MVALAAAMLLSSCAAWFMAGGAAPPSSAPWDECVADEYAFTGRTSLTALGLGHLDDHLAHRVGMVWITMDAVPLEHNMEVEGRGGGPLRPARQGRVLCIQFDGGSGMSTIIDDTWQAPDDSRDAAPASDASSVVLVAAALMVLGLVAVVAFRDRRSPVN